MSILLALLLALTSHAAPPAKPPPSPGQPSAPTGPVKYRAPSLPASPDWKPWSAGLVIGYMDYKEPGLMREYGPLYGVRASYTQLSATNIQWSADGSVMAGKLTYDGGNLAGARYTQPTSDWIIDLRGTAGLYNKVNPSWSFAPYAGIGFRDLNDKIEGTGSYNRNISYVYFPLGLQTTGFVTRTWSLSFSADLDLMVYGTVISKLSDVDPNAPDVTNHNKGLGGRVTATVSRDLGDRGFHAGLIYQKWKIDQSDGVKLTIGNQTGTLYEPENEFDFFGVTAGTDF